MSAAIQAIMFCEFHPKLGPQISYQYPEDFIGATQMDSIAPYVITKPNFHNHLISLKAFGYLFMGFSVGINHDRYERNNLKFNTCFVLPDDISVTEYEPVVTKLAGYMTTLETESGFISNEDTREKIPKILEEIMNGLNDQGECRIAVDEFNMVFLKLLPLPKENPDVLDHSVPVFLWSKSAIVMEHWGLTAQKVMQYIDGFNHVQKIATAADIDLGIVRSAVQTLVFHQVVGLIPVFLYSNMYSIKPAIHELYSDVALQRECVAYVARDPDSKPPHFRDVFMLYCALGPGVSVRNLCARHDPALLGVDEQRLVSFGVIKGLLEKLDKYPVLLTSTNASPKLEGLSRWLTGYYSYDEICCKSMALGDPIHYEDIDRKTELSLIHI